MNFAHIFHVLNVHVDLHIHSLVLATCFLQFFTIIISLHTCSIEQKQKLYFK